MICVRSVLFAVILLAIAGALAGCDSAPCPSEAAADKAGAAFRGCIMTYQNGDGGFTCGRQAYKTFCKAK